MPHGHGIGLDWLSDAQDTNLREVVPATDLIRRPVDVRELDGRLNGPNYAVKPDRFQRESYVVTPKPGSGRGPYRDTRYHPLRVEQAVELALVEHEVGLRARVITHGIADEVVERHLGGFNWARDGPSSLQDGRGNCTLRAQPADPVRTSRRASLGPSPSLNRLCGPCLHGLRGKHGLAPNTSTIQPHQEITVTEHVSKIQVVNDQAEGTWHNVFEAPGVDGRPVRAVVPRENQEPLRVARELLSVGAAISAGDNDRQIIAAALRTEAPIVHRRAQVGWLPRGGRLSSPTSTSRGIRPTTSATSPRKKLFHKSQLTSNFVALWTGGKS
jgi:hypothetical protein